ncbi:hypothetical protein N0V90_010638 [Kalmusia sp. IMI 367209]|nr:hypothetical protein N0V90_010638 [Kalmusia sp. IMI 367209]
MGGKRINHACRPNAYYRFDDFTLNFDVFSLKDIRPGEEITFSYGFSAEPYEARSKALESTWGFTCTCSLCTANSTTIAASDTRLADIAALKSSLPTSLSDLPQYIALLPRLISFVEKEGLLSELPMYEEILAYTWSAIKAEEGAKYWAERASKHWRVIAGKESWEARRTQDLLDNLEGHYTWGSYEGPDPWEGVGKGHPWDEPEGEEHDHDHGH